MNIGRALKFYRENADLMQGLPGQTAGLASADVRKAVSLGVQHISWYQLTLEAGTPMAENPPLLPDEDTLDRINAEGAEILKDAGFRHYEISGFARPGFECRHNLNYWHFGDYIGIGHCILGYPTGEYRPAKPRKSDYILRVK